MNLEKMASVFGFMLLVFLGTMMLALLVSIGNRLVKEVMSNGEQPQTYVCKDCKKQINSKEEEGK